MCNVRTDEEVRDVGNRGVDCVLCFFFFVQAEDGIRGRVRSRGLGDVYKRQMVQLQTARIVPETDASP